MLRRGAWGLLRFDGQLWHLVAREAPYAEQTLDRVDVALEWPGHRWLRLRWAGTAWRRWWPHQEHVWLRQSEHGANWTLMGAALARHGGREWLGRL